MYELNEAQCKEVSGGNWALVTLAISVYDAATDFVDGVVDGAMAQQPGAVKK